jgi:hypothetical protein
MNTKISVLIIALIVNLSCRKDDISGIPYVPVNLVLYASDPEFINLNPIGGWIYHQGGSRGLLIFRKSSEEILVYDRHCSYQPENSCGKITIDPTNNFLAIDTCCNSKFFLMDGSVNRGPATLPLRRYNCNFDGNRLTVYN